MVPAVYCGPETWIGACTTSPGQVLLKNAVGTSCCLAVCGKSGRLSQPLLTMVLQRGLLMDSSNVSPNDSQSKESLHTDGMPLQRYLNQNFGRCIP